METIRDQQLSDLLDQALDLEPEHRRRFLEQLCGDDLELLDEALECMGNDAPELEVPTVDMNQVSDLTGRTIGRYRIIEPIGEGGMGVVYLAEKTDTQNLKVALRVIKVGMDTDEVIARFEAERQDLDLLEHSNIAKVLDAGATDDHWPYFVMEYVEGVPLTDYCRDNGLGLKERLDLFIEVCRGVHHAHQKGVIHRDIKPSNILVTEVADEPVPRIVDFGVAKATGQLAAVHTVEGSLVGTPEYVSPEQADPGTQDVDTRSDVYSLGVVLYQLLTDVLPIEREKILRVGLEKIGLYLQRTVAPIPSIRLKDQEIEIWSDAPRPAVEARSWATQLKGDLDWITMKALAKSRDERYGTAEDLAEDLMRHFGDQVVLAAPSSPAYRLRKFTLRNRQAVTVGLVVLAAMALGAVGATVAMVRTQMAKTDALASAQHAEASTLFQLSTSKESPALALPFLLGALERQDGLEYRLQAKRLLLQSPPFWRLPVAPNSVNPYSIDISPDGAWMAVGWSGNGSVQLYSFNGGSPRMLAGHAGRVYSATFSQDSRLLATAALDSTVRLWSPSDGRTMRQWKFNGEVEPYFDFVRSRLITCLAVVGQPLRWQAWPLVGGPPVELGTSGPASGLVDWSLSVDLDPSRRWLVQTAGDQLVLYDMEDLEAGPVRTIGRHDRRITGVSVSTDRRTVASFDDQGGVSLWDLTAPTEDPIRTLQANEGPVFAGFDATGRKLAVSGHNGLKVWDLARTSAAQPMVLASSTRMFAGVFHPGGDWIVTTGNQGMVAAWPTSTRRPATLNIADDDQGAVGFSPDGRHLVLGSVGGTVRTVPLDGMLVGEPRVLHHEKGFRFQSVRFDDAGKYAFFSNCNGSAGEGTILRVELNGKRTKTFKGFTCDFEVDGTGRYLASSADADIGRPFVRILDTRTRATRDLDESAGGFTRAVGWTHDGWLIVKGPGGIGMYDQFVGEYFTIASDMTDAWLAQDRQTLIMISAEKELWSQRLDGSQRERLPLTFQPGTLAHVSLDSTLATVAGSVWNGPAQILHMDAERSYLYPLFESEDTQVAIDPKGRWYAVTAVTGDGLVKLITPPRGRPVEQLQGATALAQLHRLTNLRAVPDQTGDFGYRIAGEGVPDWGNPPRW